MRLWFGARGASTEKDSGCIWVVKYSRQWLCLFAQHGAGRKHERLIALRNWQKDLVQAT